MVTRCITCGGKPYVYVPAIKNFQCLNCAKKDAMRRNVVVDEW